MELVASRGEPLFPELHAKRRHKLGYIISRRGVITRFRRLTKREHAEVRGRGNDMKELRRRGK